MGLFEWAARQAASSGLLGSRAKADAKEEEALLLAYHEESARYDRLLALYEMQRPYERLQKLGYDHTLFSTPASADRVKQLRNPAHRVGEYWAAKLWPGAVENAFGFAKATPEVKKAAERVMRWSNWARAKAPAARRFSVMGDLFLRVSHNAAKTRVFVESVDPRDVVDLKHDRRGNLTYLRLDIPTSRLGNDEKGLPYRERITRTEVWSEGETLPDGSADGSRGPGTKRVWEHPSGKGAALSDLGRPKETLRLTNERSPDSAGVDFLPFVHARFKDTGKRRGVGAFEPFVEKMEELDLLAHKLHKMLFPKWPWQARQDLTGPDGEVLPAPRWGDATQFGPLDVGGEVVLRLPSGVRLDPAIPAIDFASHLAAVAAMLEELERDLSELRYWRIMQATDGHSSRAVRYQLADLADKTAEAAANAVDAVERALQMAFTLAKNLSIEGFEDLPDFGDEERELRFASVDPFPLSDIEGLEVDDRRLALYERALRLMPEKQAREYAGLPEGEGNGMPNATDMAAAAAALNSRLNPGLAGGQQPPPAPTNSPTPAPRVPILGTPQSPPSRGNG